MGFKLGKERGNYAINGEIRTKMRSGNHTGLPFKEMGSSPSRILYILLII